MPTLTDSPAVNGGARLSLGPRNVLLVEDNLVRSWVRFLGVILLMIYLFYIDVEPAQVNQRFAMALLAKLGHTVTLAINGQQVRSRACSNYFPYIH